MIKYIIKKNSPFLWPSIILMAFGIYVWSGFVTSFFEEKKYSEDGKVGIGTVLEKHHFKATSSIVGNRSESFFVYYKFSLKSTSTQSGESRVGRSMYNGVKTGDELKVEYLASDPTINRMLGTSRHYVSTVALANFAFGLFLTLLGLALLIFAIHRAIRQSRLWNKGVEITARVAKFVCDNPDATENKTYHIIYEYEGSDGESITGESQSHSRGWFLRTTEGDAIDIVADPKNPKISELRKEMQ